jgi:hypothetical protein
MGLPKGLASPDGGSPTIRPPLSQAVVQCKENETSGPVPCLASSARQLGRYQNLRVQCTTRTLSEFCRPCKISSINIEHYAHKGITVYFRYKRSRMATSKSYMDGMKVGTGTGKWIFDDAPTRPGPCIMMIS